MDWSCHGYDVNTPQQRPNSTLCEEFEEIDSDENGSSNYSDSPRSNGLLRIKRKHLRRRFMSSPETGNFVQHDAMKREPHSEPNFGIQHGNPYNQYQHVAKDVGEKVAEKYRRRASTDIHDLKPPGLKSTEASISEKFSYSPVEINADRRKSLPAKMPRKLRPIFPKGRPVDSGHNSDSSTEDKKGSDPENLSPGGPQGIIRSRQSSLPRPSILVGDDSDNNSPNVPRRSSFNQSDPLLQGNQPIEEESSGNRSLKPIRPLRINVPESDDAISLGSEGLGTTPPDSAFMSLPTSPRNLPNLGSHRPFDPGNRHHRFSSDSGVGSRKNSLIPANYDEAALATLTAHRDELLANTPARRGLDGNRLNNGLAPLGAIDKKPLCHTRSAPDSSVIAQC